MSSANLWDHALHNYSGAHIYFDLLSSQGVLSHFPRNYSSLTDATRPLAERAKDVALFIIKGISLTILSIIAIPAFCVAGTAKNFALIGKDVFSLARHIRHPEPQMPGGGAVTSPSVLDAMASPAVERDFLAIISKVSQIFTDYLFFTWSTPIACAYGFFPAEVERFVALVDKSTRLM